MKEVENTGTGKAVIFSRDTVAMTEHSLEQVGVINDVVYVNDSKSITIKQTCASINQISADIILITGGRDSTTDYSFLLDTDITRIKAIVYLGDDAERVFHHFTKYNMLLVNATNLKEAIDITRSFAKKDQVALFSPACPSYDIFDNYKNRGIKFRKIIQELA